MNEEILVVDRKSIPQDWLGKQIERNATPDVLKIFDDKYVWNNRANAETNEQVKQIIPYIVLYSVHDNKIAVYQRKGNEKRLHGLYSIGVGGHINPEDAKQGDSFIDIVTRSAKRELAEELIDLEPGFFCEFKGMINEELTKTGRTHFGLVFVIRVNKKPLPGRELLNFHWVNKNNVMHNYSFELWSEMAYKLL